MKISKQDKQVLVQFGYLGLSQIYNKSLKNPLGIQIECFVAYIGVKWTKCNNQFIILP